MKPEFKAEYEIIDKVGYGTAMQFSFMTDGMIYFKTVLPDLEDNSIFQIAFYAEENKQPEFHCYDSFSNCLSRYQIAEVKIITPSLLNGETLYFRKYKQ